jgi:hypothetical protein
MQDPGTDAARLRLPAPRLAFGKEAAAAARRQCTEADDNDCASQKPVNPARHVRDNAVEFINASSKNLDGPAAGWLGALDMVKKSNGDQESPNESKIHSAVADDKRVMRLMLTRVATDLNLGLLSGLLSQRMTADLIGEPVAAATAYLVMPTAHQLTERLVALIQPAA